MTPEDREVCLSLVSAPGRPAGDREAVLHHFGIEDGRELGVRLLREALQSKVAEDVEAAVIVCSAFGVESAAEDVLAQLAAADWHFQHEAVVSLLGKIASSNTVPVLHRAAKWVPDYLDYDESRSLAVKAIWALGRIDGEHAVSALSDLCGDDDEIVQEEAESQLKRRRRSLANNS